MVYVCINNSIFVKMLRAYKYRLSPNNEQKVLLDKHFGCTRFVYNLGLECKQMAYAGNNILSFGLRNSGVERTLEYAEQSSLEGALKRKKRLNIVIDNIFEAPTL